ncbi:VPS9 domain-containing protein 1-like [Apostichopus japonicus]|uniref:VPS9 domain-containing protein 1-like n=1 Tax=Stichopus japonicus TaxID=307972 RepID=UPI003AB21D9C
MASAAQTLNLKGAMKCFVKAMKLDEKGQNQEAYIEYLSCLQFISGSLCEEAKMKTISAGDQASNLISGESQKMMNLVQKCTERLVELQCSLATRYVHQHQPTANTVTSPQPSPATTHLPDTPSPPQPSQRRDSAHSATISPGKRSNQHQPAPRVGLSPSPTHSTVVSRKRSYDQLSPMEKAYRENRVLMVAYSARLKRIAGSKNQSAVNLTFQRRLMENMAIAREREKQLARKIRERHEQLERLAAEKFSKSGGLSRDDVELHKAYVQILEYENHNLWIQEQHERLRASPKDTNAIQDLIKDIVKDQTHPFSQLLQHYQGVICGKLEPLTMDYSNDDVRVPLQDVTILELSGRKVINADSFEETKPKGPIFSDDFMARLLTFRSSERYEEMLRDVGQDIVSWEGDEMFEELIEELIDESSDDMGLAYHMQGEKREVKVQREEGMSMEEEEEEETPASVVEKFKGVVEEVRSDLKTAADMTLDPANQNLDESSCHDEYSSDGEGEENDLEANATTSLGEISGTEIATLRVSTDSSNDVDGTDDNVTLPEEVGGSANEKSEREESEEEKVKRLQAEAMERHMENISKEIKQMVEKLVSLLVTVYEELASAVAKEQCLTIIECHFFPGVWPSLFSFFRRINNDKEVQVATAMTRYLHALPEHIGISEKFCLKSEGSSTPSTEPYPYYPIVEEVLELAKLDCPADKLECLVRVSSGVIQCVNQHYETDGQSKHVTVGCDDLLPILSFVLLKSGLPTIVSEVNAMEMFIQEGYLFGKEGYCLTTIQTALSYVFKLSEE